MDFGPHMPQSALTTIICQHAARSLPDHDKRTATLCRSMTLPGAKEQRSSCSISRHRGYAHTYPMPRYARTSASTVARLSATAHDAHAGAATPASTSTETNSCHAGTQSTSASCQSRVPTCRTQHTSGGNAHPHAHHHTLPDRHSRPERNGWRGPLARMHRQPHHTVPAPHQRITARHTPPQRNRGKLEARRFRPTYRACHPSRTPYLLRHQMLIPPSRNCVEDLVRSTTVTDRGPVRHALALTFQRTIAILFNGVLSCYIPGLKSQGNRNLPLTRADTSSSRRALLNRPKKRRSTSKERERGFSGCRVAGVPRQRG